MNILITGASKGIGKAIVENLREFGNIFVTSRNEELLKNLSCHSYFVCDLSKENELISLGNFIENNKIDVLINNAGEYIYGGIDSLRLNELNHIISVNLKAPIYLMSKSVPYMKKNSLVGLSILVQFPDVWGRLMQVCILPQKQD